MECLNCRKVRRVHYPVCKIQRNTCFWESTGVNQSALVVQLRVDLYECCGAENAIWNQKAKSNQMRRVLCHHWFCHKLRGKLAEQVDPKGHGTCLAPKSQKQARTHGSIVCDPVS